MGNRCRKRRDKALSSGFLFHHDDWGSQTRLFFSPETFQEFFLPAYKKIYGFWKSNGVEIIVHHSDSYAAEFVPYMIEMGVDVFQGAVSENNIPELIRKHGGKISVHGGLDNGKFDKADWSAEAISAELDGLFTASGARYLIPGFTMGSPGSSYPGAYEAASAVIDSLSPKYFS
jgi:uroporphyrinogen-III decarboxylase